MYIYTVYLHTDQREEKRSNIFLWPLFQLDQYKVGQMSVESTYSVYLFLSYRISLTKKMLNDVTERSVTKLEN